MQVVVGVQYVPVLYLQFWVMAEVSDAGTGTGYTAGCEGIQSEYLIVT